MNTKSQTDIKQCYFCGSEKLTNAYQGPDDQNKPLVRTTHYGCPRCGYVYFEDGPIDGPIRFIDSRNFSDNEKRVLSISLRNEYERRGRQAPTKPLTLADMDEIIERYRPLDALDKMDNALLNLDKASKYVGHKITVKTDEDFPYYHCFFHQELNSVLAFLCKEGLIDADDPENPHNGGVIAPKGYEMLRQLKRGKDSRQCFVAMWLDPEMKDVYEQAIEPAIEYVEEGETESRFRAVRIDNEEHTNDINDEIIAQIRRSRFMVCDLTGYRGGVYFEAGFAYGLGLEVIYTCREDWIKRMELYDTKNTRVVELYDKNGYKVKTIKEGIHFDLEHRNRIAWTQDTSENLSEFKDKLTKRIQAVIV